MEKTNYTLLFLLALLALSCSPDKSEIIIEPNEKIHHDDFEYSVTHYSIEQKTDATVESLISDTRFYIVTFQVENLAKRVDHPWNNSIAYVMDENGVVYENQADAQRMHNEQKPFGWKDNYVTPAQTCDSTLLIFEVPVIAKKPYLMVRGETLMGDFFDDGKFRRTKVKLFE